MNVKNTNELLITIALSIAFIVAIWFCGYLVGVKDGISEHSYEGAKFAFDQWQLQKPDSTGELVPLR